MQLENEEIMFAAIKYCLFAFCVSALFPFMSFADGPMLTEYRVTRLANAALKQAGIDPRHYYRHGPEFNYDGYGPHEWLALYFHKPAKRQNSIKEPEEFWVQISDYDQRAVIKQDISGKPNLTKREVIRLADAAVRRAGINLNRFSRGTPGFGAGSTRYDWTVTYLSKPSPTGLVMTDDVAYVNVQDRTKLAVFHRGP